MAYCVECGTKIEEGLRLCQEHGHGEVAATAEVVTGSNGPDFSQLLQQWLPVLRAAFVQPLAGIRGMGAISAPWFGLVLIVLGSLVKAGVLSSLLEEAVRKIMDSMGMLAMGALGRHQDLDDLVSDAFGKLFFYDFLFMALITVITFVVCKYLLKSSITIFQAINSLGFTQIYIVPGIILSFILGNISLSVLGVATILVVVLSVPLILQLFLRENQWIKAGQVYAVPLIFFISFLLSAILL